MLLYQKNSKDKRSKHSSAHRLSAHNIVQVQQTEFLSKKYPFTCFIQVGLSPNAAEGCQYLSLSALCSQGGNIIATCDVMVAEAVLAADKASSPEREKLFAPWSQSRPMVADLFTLRVVLFDFLFHCYEKACVTLSLPPNAVGEKGLFNVVLAQGKNDSLVENQLKEALISSFFQGTYCDYCSDLIQGRSLSLDWFLMRSLPTFFAGAGCSPKVLWEKDVVSGLGFPLWEDKGFIANLHHWNSLWHAVVARDKRLKEYYLW